MRTLGLVTTGVVGLIAAVGVVIGVRSVPDMQRYLRMRKM